MTARYLYRCLTCRVVVCDPETQDSLGAHRLDIWCPVCKTWVTAELIDTI